jgi:hypothetical protein
MTYDKSRDILIDYEEKKGDQFLNASDDDCTTTNVAL